MDGTWTIGELAERASEVLAAGGQGQVSGRVREAPNDRLIRWYVTIGLVDPPLSRAGRVARYGRRHLLQLVAVKRRQADGRSLAAIQAELVGVTDAYLESVAHLPADDAVGPDRARAAPEARFWTAAARPGAVRSGAATRFGAGGAAPLARAAAPQPQPAEAESAAADLLQGLRLAPGVLLVLDAGPTAFPAAAAAELKAAAGPLLRALARHGYPTGTDDRERKRP